MYVFRFGKIYNYDENYADSMWSNDELLIASSYYATCMYLGYNEELSYSLSYMYTSMKNQPELKYSDTHMKLLNNIFNRVEKA